MTQYSKHFLFTLMGSTAIFVTLATQPLEAKLQEEEGHIRHARFHSALKNSQKPKVSETGVTARKTPSKAQSRLIRDKRKALGLVKHSKINPNRTKKHGLLNFILGKKRLIQKRKSILAKKQALRNDPRFTQNSHHTKQQELLLNPIREITSTPEYVNMAKTNLPVEEIFAQIDSQNAKTDLIASTEILETDNKTVVKNEMQDLILEEQNSVIQADGSKTDLPTEEILAQKDPYDATADLKSFIKKLRIDEGFAIKNDTNEKMKLSIKFQSKIQPDSFKKKKISIKSGDLYTASKQHGAYLAGVKLLNNPTDRYLNPKFTPEGLLQLKIEDTQDRQFFHQASDFDFKTKKFTPAEIEDLSVSEEERSFRRDFNASYDYMDFMGRQEGVSLQKITQQRQDLYDKNNIGALLKNNPDLLDSMGTKIPLVTHKIWVTSDDAPKDPSPQYIKWLENSIEHNKTTDGWTHYFWVENKEKLPNLTKLLENHKNIKLMELDSLDTNAFITGDDYKGCIKNKKFGKATDIIRLELLRQYGGFYLDTDYELFQSLKVHAKAYDMIMGLEPMSAYLCNAFIGARPNHPTLQKSLEMIKRNLSDQAPDYIKNTSDNGFKTIIETGPALVTAAFALSAGQGDNVDVALPPQMIYPAAANVYPIKKIVTPDGKIPAEAFGAHYWNTAWMDPQFGSNG